MSKQPSSDTTPLADEIAAALRHWRSLAAFSWDRYLSLGRGAVVMHRGDLVSALEIPGARDGPELKLSYVPLEYVPNGDDYRALMKQYDPRGELLLVLADETGDDHLLRLQCAGEDRPTPEDCWRRSPLSRPDGSTG